MFRQRAGQRAKRVIQDQNRAADFSLIQLLQQIFIRRFPRLKRVHVVRFRETFKVSERKPLSKWLIGPPEW